VKKLQLLLFVQTVIVASLLAGCVMSEEPLTRFDSDSIDATIVGEWTEEDDPEGRLALWVGLRDEQTMEFRTVERDGSYTVLTGYVSRLGGATYANLQFVDAGCLACSDDERAEIRAKFADDFAGLVATDPANSCTYMIIPYVHGDDGTLRYSTFDPDRVLEAIEAGDLAGTEGDSDTEGYDVCITASAQELRRFVEQRGFDVFDPDDEVLVRRPAGAGR
jgi:hypothetical protein